MTYSCIIICISQLYVSIRHIDSCIESTPCIITNIYNISYSLYCTARNSRTHTISRSYNIYMEKKERKYTQIEHYFLCFRIYIYILLSNCISYV